MTQTRIFRQVLVWQEELERMAEERKDMDGYKAYVNISLLSPNYRVLSYSIFNDKTELQWQRTVDFTKAQFCDAKIAYNKLIEEYEKTKRV